MAGEEKEEGASYQSIWQNMPVVTREGNVVGKVTEVLGDLDQDIFDGIAIKQRFLGKKFYVSSDKVDKITNWKVYLKLDSTDARNLPPYTKGK